MNGTDLELIARYVRDHAEEAFAELVRRHLNLVYSAALRQVRSPQIAEDVSQSVFTDLARSAAGLKPDTILTAWLYQVTRRTAIDVVRREARRQLREQIATGMNAMNANDAGWTQIEPLLDKAMDALDDTDRTAVLLRYFENKSLREVGAALGTSDDAAQKRVSRAVERLREFFVKRGVTVGAGGLVALISANAIQAAPVGLAVTISAAVALVGTTLFATATITASKAIAMTTLQKILVTATVGVLAGAGLYEARQASTLRGEVQSLRQAQAPLVEQVAQLKTENEQLSNQTKTSRDLSQDQLNELLRLRGRAGASARELADLKAAAAQQPGKVPEILTRELNSFLTSITNQGRQVFTNTALRRVRQMSAKSNLSAEQQQVVRDILLANVEARTAMEAARVSGDLPLDEVMSRKDKIDEDEERLLAGVLTPAQLADFQQMKADDIKADNRAWINSESAWMKRNMKLSDDQAAQVSSILSGLKAGEGGPGITYYSNSRDQLDTRLRAFETVLTPEQLKSYREVKMEDIVDHEKMAQIIQALKH